MIRRLAVLAAVLALIGFFVYKTRTRPPSGYKPSPVSQAAAKVAMSETANAAPPAAENLQLRSKSGLKARLAAESKAILAKLPEDLDQVEPDAVSMLHVNLPSSKEVIRDAHGRITAIQFWITRFPGEAALTITEASEADDGFRMIARALVDSLAPRLEADPQAAIDELIELMGDATADLDPRVLRAAKWQASLLLDRMNLSESQAAALSAQASQSKDEILRGTLMAAAARYPGSLFQVKSWLVTETSERALKSAMGRLLMTRWRYEYSADAEVQVTDLPGNQSKISQRGGLQDHVASPDAAPELGSEVLQVVTRLLQADSSPLIPRTGPNPEALLWSEKYYGIRTDLRLIALQSLQGRITADQVPQVMSLLQTYPEPSIQKELVAVLGRAYIPEAARALSSVIENQALPIEMRISALEIVGLMRHGATGQAALERALHSDFRLTMRAASRLASLNRPVSDQTLERLLELSKGESVDGPANHFRVVYEKLRALK